MKYLYHLLIIFIALSVTACATIIDGSDQNLTFNSEPDGATVTIAGRIVGKTPMSTVVDRDDNQSLTFEKEGYKTFTTQLSTEFNGMFFGNILFGGLIGSTIDGVSGAITEFSPDQYFVTLIPLDTGPKSALSTKISSSRRIKEIIVSFGGEIRMELTSGGGEKVDALIAALGVEHADTDLTLIVIKKLADQNTNDLNFAMKLIEFYGIK